VTVTPAQRGWLTSMLGESGWNEADLRSGKGCARCHSTGFDGRRGLYEVLDMNQDMVNALMMKDMGRFNNEAQAQLNGHSLAWQAAQAVASGYTTAAEAMRIGVRQM
jgi:MSHA biogenesis protein MshE